jgi:hypothetical protein
MISLQELIKELNLNLTNPEAYTAKEWFNKINAKKPKEEPKGWGYSYVSNDSSQAAKIQQWLKTLYHLGYVEDKSQLVGTRKWIHRYRPIKEITYRN